MEPKTIDNIVGEYRAFIREYVPEFNCLDRCNAYCCTTFGSDGPRLGSEEKEKVVDAVRSLGLDDIADYAEQHDSLPATEGEPVTLKCLLLYQDNRCLLHEKAKPSVCIEFPIYISEKENHVRVDLDYSCPVIQTNFSDEHNKELEAEFKRRFGKELEINYGNSIDEKMHIYYDEEI